MCTGAILLYRIPRVVIGENSNFKGEEDLLRSRGVEVIVVDNEECKDLMKSFIQDHPEVRHRAIDIFRRLILNSSLVDGLALNTEFRNGMKTSEKYRKGVTSNQKCGGRSCNWRDGGEMKMGI